MKVRIRTVENVYPLKRVNLVPRSARLIRHLLELTKPWNAGSKSPATGLFIYLFVWFFFLRFSGERLTLAPARLTNAKNKNDINK